MKTQFKNQVPNKRNKSQTFQPIYRVYNGDEKICESILNNKTQVQEFVEKNYTIIFTGSYLRKSRFF